MVQDDPSRSSEGKLERGVNRGHHGLSVGALWIDCGDCPPCVIHISL